MSKNTDRFEWEPSNFGSEKLWADATTKGGCAARLELHIEFDGNKPRPHVSLLARIGNNVFDTDNASAWGVLGSIIPRDEWPGQIWAGENFEGPRQCDKAVLNCIDNFYREDLRDAAKCALLDEAQVTFLSQSGCEVAQNFAYEWNRIAECVIDTTNPFYDTSAMLFAYRYDLTLAELLYAWGRLVSTPFSREHYNFGPILSGRFEVLADAGIFCDMPYSNEFCDNAASFLDALETPFM